MAAWRHMIALRHTIAWRHTIVWRHTISCVTRYHYVTRCHDVTRYQDGTPYHDVERCMTPHDNMTSHGIMTSQCSVTSHENDVICLQSWPRTTDHTITTDLLSWSTTLQDELLHNWNHRMTMSRRHQRTPRNQSRFQFSILDYLNEGVMFN